MCNFVETSDKRALERANKDQSDAMRQLNRTQKKYDTAEKEIKEYTDSIKDMKRKMKFIERFVF